MGFNIKTTELIIKSKNWGVDFSDTLTIGRQTLNGSFFEFMDFFRKQGLSEEEISKLISREDRYSENFLKWLGASDIVSLDASDYEGASFIHDLNLPVPGSYHKKFSLVIDSGSLEHVFNFPTAIKSCMQMVKKGGCMIGVTPANNFFGHGFYQFSPELIYRVFSPENGFEVLKMLMFFPDKNSNVYEVSDPLLVRDRVSLRNHQETFIFYVARRTDEVEIFSSFPQQSDYETIVWKSSSNTEPKKKRNRGTLPPFIAISALYFFRKWKSLKSAINPIGTGNKKYFKKIDP
jgi:SAM-dependent methyltransferase